MDIKEYIRMIEEHGTQRGLTRTQLAAALNISENYLYRLKNGDRKPGIDFLTSAKRFSPEVKLLTQEYEDSLI